MIKKLEEYLNQSNKSAKGFLIGAVLFGSFALGVNNPMFEIHRIKKDPLYHFDTKVTYFKDGTEILVKDRYENPNGSLKIFVPKDQKKLDKDSYLFMNGSCGRKTHREYTNTTHHAYEKANWDEITKEENFK